MVVVRDVKIPLYFNFILRYGNDMRNVFHTALQFAAKAHHEVGQVRKYSGDPYIVHPIEVADIVEAAMRAAGAPQDLIDEVKAAAVMHDVLEDTKRTEQEMRDKFGPIITEWVLEVTDVSKPEDGNRAVRKAIDREHLSHATEFGRLIKLADLISNTMDIVEHDRHFAVKYLAEKELLLPVIKPSSAAGDLLYHQAQKHLVESKRKLGLL